MRWEVRTTLGVVAVWDVWDATVEFFNFDETAAVVYNRIVFVGVNWVVSGGVVVSVVIKVNVVELLGH